MKQVIITILLFFLCVNAQMERHTLQGALSLLEKAQDDLSLYDQQKPRIYIWFCLFIDGFTKVFQTITDNKLANNYAIFGSIPAVILMAGFMPLIVLVFFSYGMLKFITYEPKNMEFKYVKLPIKEIQKNENNQLQFPHYSVFGFI